MISADPVATPPPARAWRNFLWLVGGRVVRGVISLIIGVWVARYLGPGDYGILNSSIAIATLLMACGGLGLDSPVRQELVRDPEHAGSILGTCIRLRLAAGVLAYGVLLLLSLNQPAELRTVWLVAGLMLITHAPLSIDFWFQARLELRYSTIAQNTAFALSSLLRAGLIFAAAPVSWFAAAIVLEGPISAWLLFRAFRNLVPHPPAFDWNGSRARTWLRRCWPLMATTLLSVAFTQLNQVMLVWLSSDVEAGRYAAASRVFELGAFVITALVTTQIPEITATRDASPAAQALAFQAILGRVAAVAWALALPLALTAPWMVHILFGPSFRETEAPMRWLVFALLPLGFGLVRYEYWVGTLRTQRLLIVNTAGALLNGGLALVCIPRWGASGAALATLVSLFFTNVVLPFCWADMRAFATWQLQAIALVGLRRRIQTSSSSTG